MWEIECKKNKIKNKKEEEAKRNPPQFGGNYMLHNKLINHQKPKEKTKGVKK